MNVKDWAVLIIFVIGSIGFGSLGTIFTAPAIGSWYATLNKPVFNPPDWIFGPVWTILFILMGIAAFLVWRRGWQNPKVRVALTFFLVQFILNVAWSFLFFGLKNPLGALVEIIILWVFIVWTILKFYQVSKVAAYLLIPYILWVSFAAVLNFSIWRLN